MIWSFSAHATFRKCNRQWFYKKVYANSRAADPCRREAHRLSKLESIHAWRGKIVDTVISNTIIPSVIQKQACGLAMAKRKADDLFRCQRHERQNGGPGGFLESECGTSLTDDMFDAARSDIHAALDNLYRADSLRESIKRADALLPQRTLMFKHGDVTVRVIPDLLMFRTGSRPGLLDWKVNVRPLRDYLLQLVTGALAMVRCKPQRGWPPNGTECEPHEVELVEVQLLTGAVRTHTVSAVDVADAEDFISVSASEMLLALGDDAGELRPEDLAVAHDPRTCQMCPFKKLCWGAPQ